MNREDHTEEDAETIFLQVGQVQIQGGQRERPSLSFPRMRTQLRLCQSLMLSLALENNLRPRGKIISKFQ